MTTDTQFSRRGFLQGSAALGLGAGLGLAGTALWPRAAQAAVNMAFGVGTHTMGGPLVLKMQKEGMIEAAAAELGVDVVPDYQDFQALLRMLQGVAAGQLHYGMLGSTPNIRLLTSPEPAIPIALAGGGLDFPIQVPVGSDIRNMEDLRGKTILTLVGSDLHLTLNNMLKAHFGTDDVKELGITVKNMTAITELFEVQPGVDAYLGFEPGSLGAQQRGVMTTLIRNDGTTGQHYDGPEGKGAGLKLEWFKNAAYYPEGFYPHRIWWVIREDFLSENPDAVTAFLVAHHRAVVALSETSPEDIVAMVGDHWAGSDDAKKFVVDRILWRNRGWAWITEGDAGSLVGLSQISSIFEEPLTADRLKGILGKGAEVTRRAYEIVGGDPAADVFVDPNASDVRGLPQWEIDKWSL
jgi:ABC-type nitrate/sulfonate/bicarbonate transport system substrate-binding protein